MKKGFQKFHAGENVRPVTSCKFLLCPLRATVHMRRTVKYPPFYKKGPLVKLMSRRHEIRSSMMQKCLLFYQMLNV